MRQRLEILGQFTGNDADGIAFDYLMMRSFDPWQMAEQRLWRLAFLGRYCHQQIALLADMPSEELDGLVREVVKMLKAETPLTREDS